MISFKEIYDRYDGKYGHLVEAHVGVLNQLQNVIGLLNGYEENEGDIANHELRLQMIERALGIYHT